MCNILTACLIREPAITPVWIAYCRIRPGSAAIHGRLCTGPHAGLYRDPAYSCLRRVGVPPQACRPLRGNHAASARDTWNDRR